MKVKRNRFIKYITTTPHWLLYILFFYCTTSSAQSLTERIVIKGGSSAWENLVKQMYLYPEFQPGTVEYKDGRQFNRLMNYNNMLATIQFINEKSDTLAIANEQAVKLIRVGSDTFFYNPMCLKSLRQESKVKLFKNEKMRIADVRKVGAFGTLNSTGGIETPNQLYTWMSSYQIDVGEALLLSKVTTFYVESNDNQMMLSSKNNILKLFPKNAEAVKEFIKSKNINFNREKDLVELAGFLSVLEGK